MNNTENKMTGLQDSIMWLNETAKEGREFVSEQAPLYAQEYLTYAGFSYSVSLAVSLFFLTAFITFLVTILKKHIAKEKLLIWDFSDKYDRDCLSLIAVTVCLSIGILIAIARVSNLICGIIKINVAPRVALLDHVTSLINSQ